MGRDGAEYYIPPVDVIERIDTPLPASAQIVNRLTLIGFWLIIIAGIGGFLVVSYRQVAVYGQDSYLISNILGVAIWAVVSLFATLILMLVGVILIWITGMFLYPAILRKFVTVLHEEFSSYPTQYLELGGVASNFDFYALDADSRMLFRYGRVTKWAVEAVPLSMVQRFEHLTNTSTSVTTNQSSSGRISSTASNSTTNSLRFHIVRSDGRPQQIVVPFGSDEARLQNWVTELNRANNELF